MTAELFTDGETSVPAYLFTDSPTSRILPRRTVNLVSSDNGVGLSTDMDLLQTIFEEAGYDVARVGWRAHSMRECGTAFYLELLNPRLLRYASRNIGVFNMEWFLHEWRRYLPKISQLWTKSHEAQQIFSQWGLPSLYTGFVSRDLYNPGIPRQRTCLHLRGKSDLKNTEAVLEAWRRYPDLPHLTVISAQRVPAPPHVSVLPRLPQDELNLQLNTHRFHVCPSRTEGWGHYIAEGLSVGAAVITTDASPMNEHISPQWGELIPPSKSLLRSPVMEHEVDPEAIAAAVRRLDLRSDQELDDMSKLARSHFLRRNDDFKRIALQTMEISL